MTIADVVAYEPNVAFAPAPKVVGFDWRMLRNPKTLSAAKLIAIVADAAQEQGVGEVYLIFRNVNDGRRYEEVMDRIMAAYDFVRGEDRYAR